MPVLIHQLAHVCNACQSCWTGFPANQPRKGKWLKVTGVFFLARHTRFVEPPVFQRVGFMCGSAGDRGCKAPGVNGLVLCTAQKVPWYLLRRYLHPFLPPKAHPHEVLRDPLGRGQLPLS